MAKVTANWVVRLKTALEEGLREVGLGEARVASEPIRGTKLVRFMVVAPRFGPLKHFERQSIVWRIVEQTLPPPDQLKVSMILTLSDEEAREETQEVA